MDENKAIDNESLEKVVGGLLVDGDGNKYYMDYGIDDSCVCCGACVENCPMGCIEIKGSSAVIDLNRCVQCRCCEGYCPVGAIGDNRKVIVEYANIE